MKQPHCLLDINLIRKEKYLKEINTINPIDFEFLQFQRNCKIIKHIQVISLDATFSWLDGKKKQKLNSSKKKYF